VDHRDIFSVMPGIVRHKAGHDDLHGSRRANNLYRHSGASRSDEPGISSFRVHAKTRVPE